MNHPRPSRSLAFALGLLGCAFATAVPAATGNLYSVTMRTEIQGMPFQMPARTTEVCGPKNTASEQMVPHDENCDVSDFRVAGNVSTFSMSCRGDTPMRATGRFERLPNEGYRGEMESTMEMDGEPMQMKMSFEGRKLRDCDYATESPEAQGRAMLAKSCGEMLAAPGYPHMLHEQFIGAEAMCASDRTKFCGKLAPLATDLPALREAESLDRQLKAAGGGDTLWQALQGCGLPRTTVMTKACAKAEASSDFDFIADFCPEAIPRACAKADLGRHPEFIARHCPVQGEAAAKLHCVKRGFTAAVGGPYARFCSLWSAQRLRGGQVVEDGAVAPAATPAAAPAPAAEPAKKSWRDRVRDVIGG